MSDALASGREAKKRRSFGSRLASSPFFGALQTAQETAMLTGKVFKVAVKPPYSWVGDAVGETVINCKRCFIPLGISQMIWLIGFGVLNFGEVAGVLGVTDRAPGGVYVGFLREVSSWIMLMILAGVAGSALAADLGARKIREELDALAVLGVDMIRKLVVPRVVAMVFASLLLGLIGLFLSIMTYYILTPNFLEYTRSVYRESTYININPIDLYASFGKHALIGLVIGVVACQKGLSTKGGAEGVGRTVNQTVIISFVALWAINSLYNVAVLTLFPDLSVQRG